jgi:hypothetical protein
MLCWPFGTWASAFLAKCTRGPLKKPRSRAGELEVVLDRGCRQAAARTGWEAPPGCGEGPDRQPSGKQDREKRGGEPLEVDRGGGQEGLDAHVRQAAADGVGQPVPRRGRTDRGRVADGSSGSGRTMVLASPWQPSERQRWRW